MLSMHIFYWWRCGVVMFFSSHFRQWISRIGLFVCIYSSITISISRFLAFACGLYVCSLQLFIRLRFFSILYSLTPKNRKLISKFQFAQMFPIFHFPKLLYFSIILWIKDLSLKDDKFVGFLIYFTCATQDWDEKALYPTKRGSCPSDTLNATTKDRNFQIHWRMGWAKHTNSPKTSWKMLASTGFPTRSCIWRIWRTSEGT